MDEITNLIVDTLLNIDTRPSTAALAMVVEDSEVDPADCIIDVRVIEDDVGALSTKLQSNLLQVAVCGGLHDGSANSGGAGERNLVDIHVGGDRRSSNLSDTREDIDDTRGEASLFDKGSCDESA